MSNKEIKLGKKEIIVGGVIAVIIVGAFYGFMWISAVLAAIWMMLGFTVGAFAIGILISTRYFNKRR